MPKYTFEEIKRLLLNCRKEHKWEAELRLIFADKPYEYMIIMYDKHCSFQRCGKQKEQSGEYKYATLEELYRAQQVDGIILERDWGKIVDMECMEFELLGLW